MPWRLPNPECRRAVRSLACEAVRLGRDVGLPDGQVGNSEVGHMNIGAGRVVMQDLPRINAAMEDGSPAAHPELASLGARLAESGGRAHVMGLLSSGGVHSHQDQWRL